MTAAITITALPVMSRVVVRRHRVVVSIMAEYNAANWMMIDMPLNSLPTLSHSSQKGRRDRGREREWGGWGDRERGLVWFVLCCLMTPGLSKDIQHHV